jgi:hypothetical protein
MRAGIKSEHWNDANGNPEGGSTFGNGFAISWQHGPLGAHVAKSNTTTGCDTVCGVCAPGCTRRPPNGAFVEDVIDACADRIRYYQRSQFASEYNARALQHLEEALMWLDKRTKDREARNVEGTHKE